MQVYCGQSELANIGSTAYTLTIFEDMVYCHELLQIQEHMSGNWGHRLDTIILGRCELMSIIA